MITTPPTKLEPGDPAPDFEATVVGGEFGHSPVDFRLSSYFGRPIILYFYPKDDTPGCTTQACGIRDQWTNLSKTGTLILGISTDSIESHQRFITKHSLPFALIADCDKKIVNLYGVWVEKNMYGRKIWGTERTTYLIGSDGKITHIFRKVKPDSHVSKILDVLGRA
ncbi:MAG: peroxiredoxin [Chthoniobacterales bacterium]|nr:peroxiredoxin [Chthoniobacterales bacterium]MCX7713110.1 peroxiredoxin [Chthoniobacterales bacterium]